MTSRIASAALLACGLLAAGAASAQSRVWNFGDQVAPGSCPTAGGSFTVAYGNNLACSIQPAGTTTTLNVKSFSNTASGSTYATAATNYWGSGSGIGAANRAESLTSSGAPDHALDNSGTGADMLMLSFTAAEILKSVTIGWSGGDGDFQVLRWAGAGAVTSVLGRTSAQLLSDGWALVTAIDGSGGVNTPDKQYSINTGNLSSSYWLVSAYNSAFGGANSYGVDSLKVLAVGAASKVSAPGTLALAGLGLLAMVHLRRRQNA